MTTFRQKTVLVVDDEALIRFAVMDALEDAGYAVIEASTVLEAVGQLGQHEAIDLLITDVDMPGVLDGLDLARMVAECAPRIGIIVSSARRISDADNVPASVRYMPKPCSAAQLLVTVGTMLKGREQAEFEPRRKRA